MKKLFLSMAIVAMMCSCGGGQTDKATEETNKVEPTEETKAVVAPEDAKKGETCTEDTCAEKASKKAAPATAGVTELKDESQLKPTDKPIIIDFNATWCGPCKQFAPHFHAVAEKYADKALFYSVDTDKWPNVATAFKVEGIPMIAIVKPGQKEPITKVGYMEEAEFEKFVKENI